jgi:hypothetical protein
VAILLRQELIIYLLEYMYRSLRKERSNLILERKRRI